jgi:hypothetical protein
MLIEIFVKLWLDTGTLYGRCLAATVATDPLISLHQKTWDLFGVSRFACLPNTSFTVYGVRLVPQEAAKIFVRNQGYSFEACRQDRMAGGQPLLVLLSV